MATSGWSKRRAKDMIRHIFIELHFDKTQTINIAAQGDVCLVVGENEAEVGYIVDSHTPKLASPIFAALLGPRFAEGNALILHQDHQNANVSPFNVTLPEDDGKAMKLLLDHIHFRQVSDRLELADLVDLAVVVDKYQCQTALNHYATAQMRLLVDSNGFSDKLAEYLGLSIAFRSHEIFHAVTMGLALTSSANGSSSVESRVAASSTAAIVPERIITAVERLRDHYEKEAITTISSCC
ncbi:hypothetical protein LTR85_002588 [Meristemomyces frigidus]|nr:hypothetical protein LTR85_002588 [Meristemomyces frigidus]